MGWIPPKQLLPVTRASSINTNIIKLLCLTEIYNFLSVQHIVVYDYEKIYKIKPVNSGDITVWNLHGNLTEIHKKLHIWYTV